MNEQMRKCADLGDSFVKALKGASDEQRDAMFGMNKRKAFSTLDEDEGPKKRKRNVKPRDPNAPKRPASAYILFQNEIRKELKEKFPNLNNTELLAKISEMWKLMTDEEKAYYHKAVESLKERYSQDKKAYDNRTPEEVAAANAAVAEAAAAKKSRTKKKKPIDTAISAKVPARPPPAETSQSVSSEEDVSSAEDSDTEDAPADKESDSSEEEEEEPELEEKSTKKSKKAAASAQQTHKSKKWSR